MKETTLDLKVQLAKEIQQHKLGLHEAYQLLLYSLDGSEEDEILDPVSDKRKDNVYQFLEH